MISTQHCRLLLASVWMLYLQFLGIVDGFDVSLGRRSRPSVTLPIDRRSMISTVGSAVTGTLCITSAPKEAFADTDKDKGKPEFSDYAIENFTVSIPSNWKVTSKPLNSNINNNKKGQNPKLFSAIDFQSGSVITVVREQACSVQEYAQSISTCNIVLPSDKLLFSEDTIAKDISKLLIRHDDRDNAALQGTTKMNAYDLNQNVLDLTATTTLPSGGIYRDTMGIDRPNTIDRKVKAKALVTVASTDGNDVQASVVQPTTSILTLWLSAPLDEWQKPVMGTKLNQMWDSIKCTY